MQIPAVANSRAAAWPASSTAMSGQATTKPTVGLGAAQASFGGDRENSPPISFGALLGAACLALVGLAGPVIVIEALAHATHEHFAAGEPGDPKKPFRVVKVTMLEDGKKLLERAYEPRV